MRALPLLLIASMLMPAAALAQDRQRVPPDKDRSVSGGSGDSPATAVPREAPPPPPPPPAPRPEPARPAPATAAPRTSDSAPDQSGAGRAQGRQRVPPEARRDDPGNRRGGTAVPRPADQPPRRDGDRGRDRDRVYVPGSIYNNYYYPYYAYPRRYYPYGYGAFGLGYFYYDPYSWGPAYDYAYPPFRGYGYGYPTGELRLDVRPRDAEVYVDGYYAGRVDDFDGVFQSLDLEEGGYRIEIVAPGYEPLEFNVRVSAGRKVTYRGDLLRIRP